MIVLLSLLNMEREKFWQYSERFVALAECRYHTIQEFRCIWWWFSVAGVRGETAVVRKSNIDGNKSLEIALSDINILWFSS